MHEAFTEGSIQRLPNVLAFHVCAFRRRQRLQKTVETTKLAVGQKQLLQASLDSLLLICKKSTGKSLRDKCSQKDKCSSGLPQHLTVIWWSHMIYRLYMPRRPSLSSVIPSHKKQQSRRTHRLDLPGRPRRTVSRQEHTVLDSLYAQR